MTGAVAEAAAKAFWTRAGGRKQFGAPADIEQAAARTLPMAFWRVGGLTTRHVSHLLRRIGAEAWPDAAPRAIRGCLIADGGKALVLVDGEDPAEEQRLTIAHEVAHLLLHYLKPRQDAVTAFGPSIVAVLDRTRSPTTGELMSSILRAVPIAPYCHAMDRGPRHARAVDVMEDEADDLALELLAPWRELQRLRQPSPALLHHRFGLPMQVSTRLAALIGTPATTTGVLGIFGRS